MAHHKRKPGVTRTRSEQNTRSTPYERRRKELPAAPPGDIDGQWQHDLNEDLFQAGSNLYLPVLSRPKAVVAAPFPSLRPFGASVVAAPVELLPEPEHTNGRMASTSLLERLRGPGNPGNSLAERLGNGPAIQRPVSAPPKTIIPIENRKRGNNTNENRMHSDILMEKEKSPEIIPIGVKVRVRNLVEGTTSDDVKTAFSAFGTILDCKIIKQGNGLQDAEVVFENLSGAEEAVRQLDGALADNQTLRLTIEKPVVKPKPKAAPVRATTRGNASNNGPPNLLARLSGQSKANSNTSNSDNRSRNGRQTQAVARQPMAMSIPEAPSKMQADFVEQQDPRASNITAPRYPDGSIPASEAKYIVHSSTPTIFTQPAIVSPSSRNQRQSSKPKQGSLVQRASSQTTLAQRLGLGGRNAMDMS